MPRACWTIDVTHSVPFFCWMIQSIFPQRGPTEHGLLSFIYLLTHLFIHECVSRKGKVLLENTSDKGEGYVGGFRRKKKCTHCLEEAGQRIGQGNVEGYPAMGRTHLWFLNVNLKWDCSTQLCVFFQLCLAEWAQGHRTRELGFNQVGVQVWWKEG